MGNVSGKRGEEEVESSGVKNQEEEEGGEGEFMECSAQSGQLQLPADPSMVQSPPHTPRAYYSPVIFTPQAPVVPLQWPDEIMQNRSSDEAKEKTREYGVPTMITWSHGGNEVAVEGSWDDWKTREHLQRTDKDVFAIMKVLPAGVYHFRFIVDGQWRCAADFPRECDNLGNVFNVLDLQDTIPEVPNNSNWPDSPPSPESSYNSAPFTAQDFSDKVPDLPPLLQQSPLDQSPSSSTRECSSLEKPSAAVLNHLFIQRGRRAHSTVALTSTHRFRAKYVTVVLYKSLHNLKK